MLRTGLFATAAGWLLCVAFGCAHVIETRAIEGFMTALEREDLPGLKAATSKAFEEKALRLNAAVDDLKILNLPTGEVSVVSVENVSEAKKRVIVTTGENSKGRSGRRLLYTLARNPQTGKWVVDDVHVKQKKKGVTAAKSVTEQMDLLLSVRECLAAWSTGGRDDALSVTTGELKQVLSELPPAYLAGLTRRVTGGDSLDSVPRPQAEMDDDVAIVRLPRDTGEIVLTFRMQKDGWKVSDAAVESPEDGEHMTSLLTTAGVIRAATDFLTAYRQANRSELRRVCTGKLFDNSLAHADLTSVELPAGDVPHRDHEIHVDGQQAEFILPTQAEVVKISLVNRASGGKGVGDALSLRNDPPKSSSVYRVEDVTIYELHSEQEKRLSALFTAQAVMRLFSEALAAGNLDMLRQTTTRDFRQRVWSELKPSLLAEMPMGPLADEAGRVVNTVFQGAITEITVMHGEEAVTYVLRDRDGEVRVDDVLISAENQPDSLKTTWSLVLPVFKWAAGIRGQQLGILQRTSSDDFNRLTWKQLRRVPEAAFVVPRHLQAPLTAIEQDEGRAVLAFGDDRWGAKVVLVEEHGRWVVDEVLLIAGPEPAHRARLKQTVRRQMANGELRF